MQVSDDKAARCLRLLHTAPVVPSTGRANTSAPALLADKLEPDTPVRAATRAVSGSPVEGPDRAASGSPAGDFQEGASQRPWTQAHQPWQSLCG